jgi:hypothetical protein
VLSELRDNLRSGDISVAGSRQYKDFRGVPDAAPALRGTESAGELPVSVPVNFDRYISERRELLHERLEEVGEQLSEGELTDVRLRRGLISITPLKSIEPPEAESIKRLISQTLPRIKITDLLLEVDQRPGRVPLLHLTEAPVPLDQEIHLGAKGRAGLFLVKVGEEGIVLGIEDAPRVQSVGQDARQSGLAHADRPFDHDRARRLECGRWLRRGRRGGRHGRKLCKRAAKLSITHNFSNAIRRLPIYLASDSTA